MHILLTGASGCVGSHTLSFLLNQGHTCLATDLREPVLPECLLRLPPSSLTFASGVDLTSIQQVDALFDSSAERIDAVIHLSAIPNPIGVEPRRCHNINVTSNYNVLYAAASRGIKKIVQASSVNATGLSYSDPLRRHEAYKRLEEGLPLTEDHVPFLPEDAYSLSKHICEMQAEALTRLFPDIRIASLRFHHVCATIHAVERSTYRDFWSWTHLDAAASACLLGVTAENPLFQQGHQAFFIMSDYLNFGEATREVAEERQIYGILETVEADNIGSLELLHAVYPGVKVKDGWIKDKKDRRSFYDTSKAKTLLGWCHEV